MYKKSNTIQRLVRKSNDLLAKKDCAWSIDNVRMKMKTGYHSQLIIYEF